MTQLPIDSISPQFFRQRDEGSRRHQAAHRMAPADQGLGAADQPGLGIDLRLVVQLELLALERLLQIAFQPAAILGVGVHAGFEVLDVVAPVLLDEVHRRIGVRHQRLDAVAILRKQRDADAGRGLYVLLADVAAVSAEP